MTDIATHTKRTLATVVTALMLLGVFTGSAAAHAGDHGTITLHDSEDGPATDSLECEFWVKGHNMTHDSGDLFATQRDPKHSHAHELGSWNGTPNASGGWDFEAGPFTTHAADSDRIEVWTEMGTENDTHWEGEIVDYRACDEEPEEEPQPPECPDDLQAHAEENGDITLTWNASENANTYHVYRSSGEGFEQIAETDSTIHTDSDTEADVTYQYRVDAVNEDGESVGCAVVEATAIPVFSSPAAIGLAAASGVGALLLARRVR